MKNLAFLLLAFTLNSAALADHSSQPVHALSSERAKELQVIFKSSAFAPIGGTVSLQSTKLVPIRKPHTIDNYTLVCLEMNASNCSKPALLSELNLQDSANGKVYSLQLLPSNVEKYRQDQVPRFKDSHLNSVNESYTKYYLAGTAFGIMGGAYLGAPAGQGTANVTSFIGLIVGGVIDLAKSPLVAIAHGVNYSYASIVSSSDAKDIFSFLTDSSKAGQLLQVSASATYDKKLGLKPTHFHIDLSTDFVDSNLGETDVYEVDGKFFNFDGYYDYIRRLKP